MPIYDMECLSCGHVDEYFYTRPRTKDDDEGFECRVCGSPHGRKLVSKCSFRLHNDKVGGFTNTNTKTTGG